MCTQLARQIRGLPHGEHLCLIYENATEQLAAVVPFLQEGLARNDRCVYVADESSAEEVTQALAAGGVDVAGAHQRGALILLTPREAYLRSGEFDPHAMIDFLHQAVEDALAAGFSGLRGVGEMTWALGTEAGRDRLIEYEALLNDFFPTSRASGLCLYHRPRFAPSVIHDILRTHPVAVLGDLVCPNLYYEPPMVLHAGAEAGRVDWMIAQLRRAAAVGQTARDLNARLAEEGRRKDEFLATLSHELRNPLAPLRNALHVLRHADADGPTFEKAHDVAERQVRHLARLVDDLLDISRITRGKVELRRAPVDLASAVAEAVETVRPLVEARRHELSVLLPAETLRLEADPIRLEQVLANLLTNAAKYTEPGGRIWLTAERDDSEVVLRVRDTGVGIPAAMLARVFDLFTQVEGSSEHSQGGLGIGLTLVRSLVEMHGGNVEARSEGLGQGSEFVVRLPALPETYAGQAKGKGSAWEPGKSRALRVLVVEDNVDAAKSLAILLRLWGHEVHLAPDGPAALEMARVHRPEVVLLDIGLPGMDGYEVARRLREQGGPHRPLLLAMTGYGREEDCRRAQEAGFDRHLVKPVDLEELEGLLAQLEWLRPPVPLEGPPSPSEVAA